MIALLPSSLFLLFALGQWSAHVEAKQYFSPAIFAQPPANAPIKSEPGSRQHVSSPHPSLSLTPACNPDCTPALLAAISECGSGPCTINFAPGTYPVGVNPYNAIANVANAHDFALVGLGATLLLTQLNAGFGFSNVRNLTITGLTFEMQRLPYTYGQAIAIGPDGNNFTLCVNLTSYPFPPDPIPAPFSWLSKVQSIFQYDPVLEKPAPHGLDAYLLDDPAPVTVDRGQGTVTVTYAPSRTQVVVGQWYILRHQVYSLNAITLDHCGPVQISDVTMYTVAGMGVYGQLSHDITLERVSMAKRAISTATGSELRPMSLMADAVHFNACNGTIVIRDSLFEGQGDDGLNVHGKFGVVGQVTSGTAFSFQPSNGTEHCDFLGTTGDTIEFRDRTTFQPYATALLLSLSGSAATVDRMPANAKVGDLVVSLSWMPSFTSVNNTYRNNRARGQLLKTHNVLVVNNTYDGCTGPAVQVFTDGCYWFESTAVHNWTVSNNTIMNVNYGAAQLPGDVYVSACTPGHPNLDVGQAHTQVSVDSNTFIQSQGQAAVAVWATDTLSISRNSIQFTGTPNANIMVSNSVRTTVDGNVCAGLPQCRIQQL